MRRHHRLLGVDHQVQQHLLDLVRVGEHRRQARRQRVDGRDARQALLVRAQRQRVAHHLVDVDERARRVPLPGEGQQVADDPRGPFGLAEDGLEGPAQLRVHRLVGQALRRGEDRGQRVVQFVGHARDRLTERRQLLGLQQLLVEVARLVVEPLALGDVAHHRRERHASRRRRRGSPWPVTSTQKSVPSARRTRRRRSRTAPSRPRRSISAARDTVSANRPGSKGRTSASGAALRVPEHHAEEAVGGKRCRTSPRAVRRRRSRSGAAVTSRLSSVVRCVVRDGHGGGSWLRWAQVRPARRATKLADRANR